MPDTHPEATWQTGAVDAHASLRNHQHRRVSCVPPKRALEAARLQAARWACLGSRPDAAEQLGLDEPALEALELGKKQPTQALLQRFALVTACPLGWLLNGTWAGMPPEMAARIGYFDPELLPSETIGWPSPAQPDRGLLGMVSRLNALADILDGEGEASDQSIAEADAGLRRLALQVASTPASTAVGRRAKAAAARRALRLWEGWVEFERDADPHLRLADAALAIAT